MTSPVPDPGDYPTATWGKAVAQTLNDVSASRQRIASGRVLVTPKTKTTSAIGTYFVGSAGVTFPVGTFFSGPIVVVKTNSAYPGTVIQPTISGVSHAGFTVFLARSDKTPTYVYWLAVEQNT